MEFTQTTNGWHSKESNKWSIKTLTGMTMNVKDPSTVPCCEMIPSLKFYKEIIPYKAKFTQFKREGHYFDWFDEEWVQFNADDMRNDRAYKRFMTKLKKFEDQVKEQERIREIDRFKARIAELEQTVKDSVTSKMSQ